MPYPSDFVIIINAFDFFAIARLFWVVGSYRGVYNIGVVVGGEAESKNKEDRIRGGLSALF